MNQNFILSYVGGARYMGESQFEYDLQIYKLFLYTYIYDGRTTYSVNP